MNKQRKQIIANNEVSDLYTLNLGGYKQKVLVEGKSKTLPVVICLRSLFMLLLTFNSIHRLSWECKVPTFCIKFLQNSKIHLTLSAKNISTAFDIINKCNT